MWKLGLLLGLAGTLAGAELRGVVQYGGLPVPGVSVVAVQGTTRRTALTDGAGAYSIAAVAQGTWTIQVEMQLFATQRQDVVAGTSTEWALVRAQMPEPQIRFEKPPVRMAPRPTPTAKAKPEPEAVETDEGLLINGSVNNGASSPFAQLPAFGNNRKGQRSQYNGNLGFILNNALFDARAFSLTGQNTAKPDYSQVQGLASFGGPIKIPRLLERNGPVFSVNYQWTRNRSAAVQTGLMPTAAQRDSLTNPQAIALVRLYPLPNFAGSSRYNYQTAVVNGLHQDDLQARVQKSVRRNSFTGSVAWQRLRTDSPDLFGFLDTGRTGGGNVTLGYRRSFNPRTYFNVGTQMSWLENVSTPYFAGRRNVSGEAGVRGNNQDPVNWGPPGLEFASGITPLRTGQAASRRNQTAGLSLDGFAGRGKHNLSGGGTYRRQQFNLIGQEDARGTFVFTGDDWSKFGRGTPDTATIAFGNADKYLRGKTVELFGNDDWRINPALTINAGLRWEYWSPLD
ncbi:MAG: carboxypeptidase regulatory-like domain-containing protein, partial [Acidobacteria bacterium]|nr:carboxypeptidase regulatory-like domain-containing protein [Acidobacteriota bacterium]